MYFAIMLWCFICEEIMAPSWVYGDETTQLHRTPRAKVKE